MRTSIVSSMSDAIRVITDGASVAIGGHTLRRHPMALIREIIRQGRRDLHIMGWNNGIDMDLLIGSGCVATVETSYVGMGPLGLALNLRRWAESGRIAFVDHTETTAIDMFRATALGVDFLPNKTPLGTDLMTTNDGLVEVISPFSGNTYAAVRGVQPEVAIIHAHTSDEFGNIQLDTAHWMDNSIDPYIARSARHVIVSVEQIVSSDQVRANPLQTVLPREYVDAVVEAPFGAHPCCCDARYGYDVEELRRYQEAAGDANAFEHYLQQTVFDRTSHWDYLDAIGVSRLLHAATASTQ